MKTMILLLVTLGLLLSVAAPCSAAPAVPAQPPVQFDPVFPERDPSTRALINNKRYFHGYAGRGTLYIRNYGTTAADIYVNGHAVNTANVFATSNGTAAIDIGKYARDGENYLLAANITPNAPPTTPNAAYFEMFASYPKLTSGSPESVGMSSAKLKLIDEQINREIAMGFPGAQLLVIKNGVIIKNTAYGYTQVWNRYDSIPRAQRSAASLSTLFDLASNSKMYATNLALMHMSYQGKLNVDDKVSKYLPEFTGKGREGICVRNLLEHNAGFAPEITFFKEKAPWFSQDRATTIKLLMAAPLVYPTGSKSVYSDTDFMLLGLIVEAISGTTEDKYCLDNLYTPLGLKHTTYNPLQHGFSMMDCAATERNGNTRDGRIDFPNIRTYTLRGEVHDEKAWYSMGGVAGHAGLFSTTSDLAVLMQMMLNRGGYGDFQLCDGITEGYFTQLSNATVTRGLGWLKPGAYGYDNTYYTFGPYAPLTAFGHNGWTGTMTVIDPENDLAIALLSDCIHSPGLPNDVNGFVCKAPPFETGLMGGIIAMVYEARK